MKKLSVKTRHTILSIVLPIIAILAFLAVWQGASQQIQTNIGNLPGPVEVLNAFKGLMSEFSNQREAAKTFYAIYQKDQPQSLARHRPLLIKF